MSSFFVLRTLLFAGEMFAGSTLILLLAWLAAAQKAASIRHLIWTGAMGALLALPVLAALAPSGFRILLAAPQTIPATPDLNDAALTAPLPHATPDAFSFAPSTLLLALGAFWLAGMCVVALRLAVAMACLAALKRRSRPHALAPDDEPNVAATAQECELRLSDRDTGPISWGVFRPVILLPKSATSWPRERLHAVLLHELAHIRRRDSFVQALSHAACAFYWPNPLVWIAAKRLRSEAELAADDAAISAGLRPSDYAGELLRLAHEFRAQSSALTSVAFFMAAPSALEERVESLLSPTQIRSGVTTMDVLKITSVGLLAAAAIAFACPSLAQESQPAAPAAVAAPAAPPAVEAAPLPPPAESASQPQPPAAPEAMPPAPAAPAAIAAPAAPDVDAENSGTSHHHVWVNGRDFDSLSPEEKKQVRIEIVKARREAREAMAKARPQIEKAMAQVRASEAQVRASEQAMRDMQPRIEKAIAEARVGEHAAREAQPQIDAAMAEVEKARPEIDKALAKVQPEIDAALAKVRADLAKEHIDVRIRERVDLALKRAQMRIEAAQSRDDAARHDGTTRVEESTTTTDGK